MRFFWSLFLLVGLQFVVSTALATEITLKNGTRYVDVTVVSQSTDRWIVQTQFGEIKLPEDQIETIDGKPLRSPKSAPAPSPSPALTPVPTTPGAQIEPTPKLPAYKHNFTIDQRLGVAFLAFLLYLGQLVWVQHEMNRRAKPAALWNSVVFLLPGAGLLLFLLVQFFPRQRTRKTALYGGNEDVAEAAKKRSLFKSDAKSAQPKGQGIGLRFIDEKNRIIPTIGTSKKESGLEIAREVLEAAVVQRASDIHIEPQEATCRVRFRVDGQLSEHRVLERTDGIRLITSLKSLGGIDVAEKRKAQDGRFHVKTDIREVDFRVATANSIHGEKVVIRILDRKGGLLSLDQVGMSSELEALFDRTIRARAGMIIVTGPTGSGKTSTLYAALSRLDREKLNIMTIEDPVEYELPGATQIPVAPKAGTTYESGLRSILRQDPDVILVGEMRDAEAATVAIRAALTGHLVFTSLHTRDSIATLVRLEEMGMERSQMASALIMLVAQRLVRILCSDCRRPVVSTGQELLDLGVEWEPGATVFEPAGCPECDGSGYRGRTGIFEVLVMNDPIRQAVQQGASQEDILALARTFGFRPYREDGAAKALQGITSFAEVREAT